MRQLVLLSAAAIAALGGCAPDGAATAPDKRVEAAATNPRATRIIVKFRAPAAASAPAFVRQLADTAGVELTYVRALSGDAHVYRVEGVDAPDKLARVVERLSKRPDVEYAEPDRIMRIQ